MKIIMCVEFLSTSRRLGITSYFGGEHIHKINADKTFDECLIYIQTYNECDRLHGDGHCTPYCYALLHS